MYDKEHPVTELFQPQNDGVSRIYLASCHITWRVVTVFRVLGLAHTALCTPISISKIANHAVAFIKEHSRLGRPMASMQGSYLVSRSCSVAYGSWPTGWLSAEVCNKTLDYYATSNRSASTGPRPTAHPHAQQSTPMSSSG